MLLGLDVGTSGARALAVDAATGAVLASAAEEYSVLVPHPGWAEQDPEAWWTATRTVLAAAAREAGGEVVGLGLSGQMHGAVFLDEADRVLRPALLWNDQRTAAQASEITRLVGERELVEATGNPAMTGFQAPKVLWLREHEPELHARVRTLLLPKDHVRLRLTGERATDASDASGTLLLDVRRRRWSDAVLERLEIPHSWLPDVREGPDPTGTLRPEVAQELGLPAGVVVAAGGGDNAAGAVGCGVAEPGSLSCSVGTSGVLFAPTPGFAPDPSGRIHAFCHALPGVHHLTAVTLSAGGSLRWWRDVLGAAGFEELVDEAARAPVGASGLLFLPYLTGERTPHLDPEARGAFFGLTIGHDRAAMTRAVMEGIVLSLRSGLRIMQGLGVVAGSVLAVGGGARSPVWRRLQADVLGLPVRRPVVDEGPAHGAALLAGVAAGVYRDAEEAMGRVRLRPEVDEPDAARVQRYAELHETFEAFYPATRELAHRLGAVERDE